MTISEVKSTVLSLSDYYTGNIVESEMSNPFQIIVLLMSVYFDQSQLYRNAKISRQQILNNLPFDCS